jgi:hypothetical protein
LKNGTDYHGSGRLAGSITDTAVRALFERFIEALTGLHDGIRVHASSVELRFFYQNEFLCRLAPYRDLFHVQIGEVPAWETRVRSEAGLFETIDVALQHFLKVYAASSAAQHPDTP